MEGQLNKYTNVVKGWQFRWFVLDSESGMLEYFEKEEHKKQRPRGYVHLAGAVISPSDEDSQTFSVSAANGEIYRLKATNTKERQLWVDKLRTTVEHQAVNMSNSTATRKETRSSSLRQSLSDISIMKKKTPESQEVVVMRPHKAPAPHPHTLDPFKEVKEYIAEANDYSLYLTEKINSLPANAEPIGGLDKDLLLLKATSTATLSCLGQCLKMLQHQQFVQIVCKQGGAPYDWHESFSRQRNLSTSGSQRERNGSFSSVTSAPITFPEERPEGPINHDDEEEDQLAYTEEDLGGVEEHKTIILHLLSQLKLGMDLTKVVLPTFILERRSLLEMFADCMAHPDMFIKIPDLPDPESRMLAVIEWYLTSFHAARQGSVAKKPYNPIIGETFHCSWKVKSAKNQTNNCQVPVEEIQTEDTSPSDTEKTSFGDVQLVYCAEQVSHHPPISAFYFECPEKQMCMNASIYTKSRFYGMSIGVNLIGKVCLKLLEHDEEYVFGMPSAYARSILTVPWAEMGDKISVTCAKTNYSASVTFHTKPFYGGKLHKVSAEIKKENLGEIICKVQGEWNNVMEFSFSNGSTKTIDVKDIPIGRKRVRPCKMQGEFESRRLWQHVTNALRAGDVNTASEHKRFLEERQREGEKHRKETGTTFPTKYFHKENDCWVYNKLLTKGDYQGSL